MKETKGIALSFLLIFILCVVASVSNSNQVQFLPKSKGLESLEITKNGLSKFFFDNNGTPICVINNNQSNPQICTDGSHGAIITWTDARGSDKDIYAQRIDYMGNILWTTNGIPLCTEINDQENVKICSDGNGGAIVVWEDYRAGTSTDVYAQRIDENGNVLWAANGIEICTSSGNQQHIDLCFDGDGAIITWSDWRLGCNLYAQRIDLAGDTKWTANGTLICNMDDMQDFPDIICNDSGDAIIVWRDLRGTDRAPYAQLIDSGGSTHWDPNGTLICDATDIQEYPKLCSDGAGGAIIAWQDRRDWGTQYYDVYANRINSSGNLWSVSGAAICTDVGWQQYPEICSDDADGAIIIWRDQRGAATYNLFAQRIDSNASIYWAIDGVLVCSIGYTQEDYKMCSDGSNGAFITWNDKRNGASNYDIFIQKLDSNGNIKWHVNGLQVCTAINSQRYPQICNAGSDGAIVTWEDYRNGNNDIYVQKISGEPTSNHPEDITTTLEGSEVIRWVLSDIDAGGNYTIWVNDTINNYIWIPWTIWTDNTIITVPLIRDEIGTYYYTIEYYDNESNYGVSDTVIVNVMADAPESPLNINIWPSGGVDTLQTILLIGLIGAIGGLIIISIVIARNTRTPPATKKELKMKKA